MPDLKVSTRQELAFNSLDPEADLFLVTDTSANASRAAKAAELFRAAAPYLSTAWDFATGSLSPTVTLTRASSGYRYNSAGLLVSETTDAPRFQYDPATLTPRGLLIEGSVTNEISYSEDISNAAYTKTAVTITADAIAAPDGATTMDKMNETVNNNSHLVQRSVNVTSGVVYSISAFAKAAERSWLALGFGSGGFGSNTTVFFDLTNGVIGTVGAGATAFMTHVGGGIYHCVAFKTATATAASNFNFLTSTNGSLLTYVGTPGSGIYLWGLSVRAADSISSYIQTTTASATRAADVALIANRHALTDQCWVVKARTPRKIAGGASNIVFQVDDGTNNNCLLLRYGTDNRLNAIATVGGATQCALDLGVVANDTDFAVSVRWADNNFAASLNGGSLVTDASGSRPVGLTAARVGCGPSGNYWNSTIKLIETRRLATDAELVLLSQ